MSGEIVLVTGASGYLATHVVQQLQAAGYKVRGTVRSLKNEERVAPLRNLCPGAKYPLELVEADLMKSESWTKAVEGCKYVFHTASPFLMGEPKDPEAELIKPAVEGTTSVLSECAKAGVTRVVLTSSMASIAGDSEAEGEINEERWTVLDKTDSYSISKAKAEKAGWDLVAALPDDQKFELACVNPGLVMGPPLCGGGGTSMGIAMGIISGAMPMLPANFFGIVDVRDLAKSHIQAMFTPEAAGNRHILISECQWMKNVAQIFAEEFTKQGYNVVTEEAPNQGGPYSKELSLVNKRMKEVLKVEPRPVKQTCLDMGYSLIEQGKLPKTDKYTGPPEGINLN